MNKEIMNTLDGKYQELLIDILNSGVVKKDRTGTGTISVFGRQIRHNMKQGFPLLTTKRMAWKTMVTELIWFLRGDTNIKYLVDNGCNIWNGDAFKRYNETYKGNHPMDMTEFIDAIKKYPDFAKEYGELGPIYGKQWRDFGGEINTELSQTKGDDGFYSYVTKHKKGIDQIQNLIDELKTNPDSRRLMVSAWNVSELNQMLLPPCHYGFQVYTRELNLDERIDLYNKGKINTSSDYLDWQLDHLGVPQRYISLMWNQRSVDTFLGLPFNIASYGLLLLMIADEVNMVPDELIGNLGDVHLYLDHVKQAEEQTKRDPFNLPNVKVKNGINCNSIDDITLENYISHPSIKAPLSN